MCVFVGVLYFKLILHIICSRADTNLPNRFKCKCTQMYIIDRVNRFCSQFLFHVTSGQRRSVGTSPSLCSQGHGCGRLMHQSKPKLAKSCLSWCSSRPAGARLGVTENKREEEGPIITVLNTIQISFLYHPKCLRIQGEMKLFGLSPAVRHHHWCWFQSISF